MFEGYYLVTAFRPGFGKSNVNKALVTENLRNISRASVAGPFIVVFIAVVSRSPTHGLLLCWELNEAERPCWCRHTVLHKCLDFKAGVEAPEL